MAPADSPMMHTMKVVREFYPEYRWYKFLVISPCTAKKREFEEVVIGDYNVTMKKLNEYFEENQINLKSYPEVDYDNPPAERAVLFSTPGGLLRTAQRENESIESITRKIEGPQIIYHYLNDLEKNVKSGNSPLLIDCLNCEAGCNGGTGTSRDKSIDEMGSIIEKRNKEMQERYKSKFIGKPSKRKIRKTINKFWKNGLYERKYKNLSQNLTSTIRIPDRQELNEIYSRMQKSEKEDYKDCAACGYDSCEKMAIAIFNGLNKP